MEKTKMSKWRLIGYLSSFLATGIYIYYIIVSFSESLSPNWVNYTLIGVASSYFIFNLISLIIDYFSDSGKTKLRVIGKNVYKLTKTTMLLIEIIFLITPVIINHSQMSKQMVFVVVGLSALFFIKIVADVGFIVIRHYYFKYYRKVVALTSKQGGWTKQERESVVSFVDKAIRFNKMVLFNLPSPDYSSGGKTEDTIKEISQSKSFMKNIRSTYNHLFQTKEDEEIEANNQADITSFIVNKARERIFSAERNKIRKNFSEIFSGNISREEEEIIDFLTYIREKDPQVFREYDEYRDSAKRSGTDIIKEAKPV